MRVTALVVAGLALSGIVAIAPVHRTMAASTCHGKAATIVVGANHTGYGTAGNDVIVGTDGDDLIIASGYYGGGVDLVCGGRGNDEISVAGPGSYGDGGSGSDDVSAFYGATAFGGSGSDDVYAQNPGGIADGGSGSDDVEVRDGAIGRGGSGYDNVIGTYAAALYGDAGSDALANFGGDPLMDCGSADDDVYAYGATTVRNCENKLA